MSAGARRLVRFARTGSTWARTSRDCLDYLQSQPGYDIARFVLVVDLELAWSVARRGEGSTSRADALERARRARANLPVLLELCDRYDVPLTVALVAHAALDACTHADPPAFTPSWIDGDWYDLDPRTGAAVDPLYYCPDLVAEVCASGRHEIASHSFSHVDFGDDETPADVARFELAESFRILDGPATLVFPKDHVAFLDLVAETGFTTYRDRGLFRIAKDEHGLWRIPRGLWLSPDAVGARELRALVDAAAARAQLLSCYCHLYEFRSPRDLERLVDPLFAQLAEERAAGRIAAETVGGVVDAVTRR
jgi:hypothetical protein